MRVLDSDDDKVAKRDVVGELLQSADPFVRGAIEMSKSLDGDDVRALLQGLAKNHDTDLGNFDDYLLQFDWDSALKLLPMIMEYADTLKDSSGEEKEQKTIALLLRLAYLAGYPELLDEYAISTLRLVIATTVQVSKGEFKINAQVRRNALQVVGNSISWAIKHCKCAGGDRDDSASASSSTAASEAVGSK